MGWHERLGNPFPGWDGVENWEIKALTGKSLVSAFGVRVSPVLISLIRADVNKSEGH